MIRGLVERGNIPNHQQFLQTIQTANNYNQTIARTVWGQVSRLLGVTGTAINVGIRILRILGRRRRDGGQIVILLRLMMAGSDGGDGNGRGNEANGGAVLC